MQRAVGYTLTGQTSEESLFLLYGLGANGKSTLLTVLRKVMGDYATVTPFSTFVEKKNDTGIPNDLAALKGARLVMASETKRSAPLAEAIIKQVTGRDPITARFLFGEYFTFVPEFKLWIATNHKPRIIGTDNGIWRRVKLIPFDVQIPDAEQDHHLDKKLEAELSGILNWALEGLRDWAANGLGVPPSVKEATEEFRANEDVLGHFIGAECVVGEKAKVKSSELYGKYKDWAAGAGEKYRLTQKDFSIAMTERGWQVRHTRGGNLWAGIGLKGKDYDLEEGLTQV
jgi:putative DNA primase/helicase